MAGVLKERRKCNARRCAGLLAASLWLVFLMGTTAVYAQQSNSQKILTQRQAEQFAARLLSKMTLEEKIGQLSQLSRKDVSQSLADERTKSGQVGSFLFVTNPVEVNRLQRIALQESRLHIPLLFGYDVIHGFRTIYPVPIALASTWDPAFIEKEEGMAAKEASSVGEHWAFSPMVDIARDPRWGRIVEGSGEDPYLGSAIAAAKIRGLQGPYIGSPGHLLACVKHFAGYGAALGGRDYEESNISDDDLYNVYLPPFHSAVQAGAATVMSAYMDLNGVPATGNSFLLRDVLRRDWGFKGFVVSDWDSVKSLATHGFASDPADAAVRALNAGVDMEMTSETYRQYLPAAVRSGTVSMATIDAAVMSILEMKYRMGLFSNPYASEEQANREVGSPEQKALALEAARRSAVLLRNEGGLLPLKKTISSIAVIGPLADSKIDTLGPWSLGSDPRETVTVLEGIKKKLGSEIKINSTIGVEIERGQASIFDDQITSPKAKLKTEAERQAEFEHAIDLVKESDIAVLVLGEAQTMNGERASRATLTLPGRQEQLLEAAVATGKPVVLLLLGGRPLDIVWASQHVPAILEAWYPGTEGGNAVADLLFGDANPSGKLPMTWPRAAGQLPLFYNRRLTQIPDDQDGRYWDMPSSPLYPFGFGLSYTTFRVDNLRLSQSKMTQDGDLVAKVDVQNTGSMAGDEVIQLYTHQRFGSASRPIRELKGFTHVTLQPGETRTVDLKLKAADLSFWSPQTHRWAVEPSTFDVWVGDNSQATLHEVFRVEASDAKK